MVTSAGAARWALEALALSHQLLEPGALRGLQRLDLELEPPPLERARHHHLELRHLQGFGEEVVGSAGDGLRRDLARAVRSHHDDRRVGREVAALRDGVEPVHVGQAHVEEDQVPRAALERVEHPARGRGHLDVVILADEGFPEDEREILVVLGDQDPLSHEKTLLRARRARAELSAVPR
jgi:hypothetical protein